MVQKFGTIVKRNMKNLYRILQNRMIRKILGIFKTTPFQAMKIESHVLLVRLRLFMKNQKYTFRLLKIAENNPFVKEFQTHIRLNSKISVFILAYGTTNMPNGTKTKNKKLNDILVSLFAFCPPFRS